VAFLGDVLILRLSILNSAYLARSKVLVGDSELVNANAFFWWYADLWSLSGCVDRSNHFRTNLLMEFDMRSNVLLKPTAISLVVNPRSTLELSVYGYGACSSSGCNCKSYEGNGATCGNCGHNYDRHW
jgi:hypothetical protein